MRALGFLGLVSGALLAPANTLPAEALTLAQSYTSWASRVASPTSRMPRQNTPNQSAPKQSVPSGNAISSYEPAPSPAPMSASTPASTSTPAPDTTVAPANAGVYVYVLRGWLDVFSTGMDDLAVKLNRRGVRASAYGHVEYYGLAESIASRYKSGRRETVVIVGHSLGANAAVQMAQRLNDHKIPVQLVVTYDPTIVVQASPNIARLVNFFQSNNGWGTRVQPAPGFRGVLENLDLAAIPDLGHVGIDKSNKLHQQTIGYVQSIGSTRTAARPRTGQRPKDDDDATVPAGSTSPGAKRTPPQSSQAPASSTERRPRL